MSDSVHRILSIETFQKNHIDHKLAFYELL